MKRFRLQDNVPDTYIKRSRDFQLMCNLFDLMNNGVKFDIDTIRSLSDTTLCRHSMLTYLQHKLGLYMSADITEETLRPILKCFQSLVRKKGSKQGVVEAICLFLTIMHSDGKHEVEIFNGDKGPLSGNYVVAINVETTRQKIPNIDVLDQLLKYIIPTGYVLTYNTFVSSDGYKTETAAGDEVNILFINESARAAVRPEGEQFEDEYDAEISGVIGGLGTTVIKFSDSSDAED